MSNLPTARPMPPSTATKTGRCAIGKCKGTTSTDQKREGTNKKKKPLDLPRRPRNLMKRKLDLY